MSPVHVWGAWLCGAAALAGLPVPAPERVRRGVGVLAWEQLVVLVGSWVVAQLAIGTGLLVLVLIGRPDLRWWCLLPAVLAVLVGGLVAGLPLLRPARLARRLGLRPGATTASWDTEGVDAPR